MTALERFVIYTLWALKAWRMACKQWGIAWTIYQRSERNEEVARLLQQVGNTSQHLARWRWLVAVGRLSPQSYQIILNSGAVQATKDWMDRAQVALGKY